MCVSTPEKYLKAILVLHGRDFPRVHDLLSLSDLCVRAGIIVPIDPDDLDRLSALPCKCAILAKTQRQKKPVLRLRSPKPFVASRAACWDLLEPEDEMLHL